MSAWVDRQIAIIKPKAVFQCSDDFGQCRKDIRGPLTGRDGAYDAMVKSKSRESRIVRRYAVRSALAGGIFGAVLSAIVIAAPRSDLPPSAGETFSVVVGCTLGLAVFGFFSAYLFFARFAIRAEQQRGRKD